MRQLAQMQLWIAASSLLDKIVYWYFVTFNYLSQGMIKWKNQTKNLTLDGATPTYT